MFPTELVKGRVTEMKIGRNAPCTCGSGKKYKHCCGSVGLAATQSFRATPDVLQQAQLQLQRREAKEHQRRLMQGLGRPIISFDLHGYRVVAVGNQLRWSNRWRTFHDFLLDYIKNAMTPEWGNAELAKPEAERHPLIQWFSKCGEYQRRLAAAAPGQIYSGSMTGAVKAFFGLGYDLYLCEHNAELPPLLLKRLRNRATFEGALYEAYVVGLFARAGFLIEMEDEEDSTRMHCEFVATHKETGRKFSVEAKAVTSASRRAGATSEPPKIRNKLYEALLKDVSYPRIVFIELGRTHALRENGEPDWAADIDREIEIAERELTIRGQPAPPAYVFVTNRAFMLALDSTDCSEAGVAYGFKIDEFVPRRGFPSILEAARARDRHIEPHWLMKTANAHLGLIPSSFDDRLPEEVFKPPHEARLRVGEIYLVPDESGRELPGVLCTAAVLENEKRVYGTYQFADGRSVICTVPLTDDELAIYRRSPDTFFGVVSPVSKRIKTPLDAYDFAFETYSKTSREKLLDFMAAWPGIERLRTLPQTELAREYSAGIATMMWATLGKPKN
jgi:hypothetical protein